MAERSDSPVVVGIAGAKEVGKTTMGKMLREISELDGQHFDLSDPIVAMTNILLDRAEGKVAATLPGEDPLFNSIAKDVAHGEVDKFIENGYTVEAWNIIEQAVRIRQVHGHAITLETKPQFRPLLESFVRKALEYFGDDYWTNMVTKRAQQILGEGAELLTVGSIRYPGNAQAIRQLGGRVVRLKRGVHTTVLPTEEALYSWKADYRIENNDTLPTLRGKATRLWQVMRSDSRPIRAEPAEELLIE
jgi:hypothetical protein